MNNNLARKIQYQAYLNREQQYRHHRYNEELAQYLAIKLGDVEQAREQGEKMFGSNLTGKLSADELRNKKYLFVAATTLATRFAIQGGMPEEKAYNTSDLFIQEMDKLTTTQAVTEWQTQMMVVFAQGVRDNLQKTALKQPLIRCIEYIEDHLHGLKRLSAKRRRNGQIWGGKRKCKRSKINENLQIRKGCLNNYLFRQP